LLDGPQSAAGNGGAAGPDFTCLLTTDAYISVVQGWESRRNRHTTDNVDATSDHLAKRREAAFLPG
jgi:hypothetical protein